MLPENEYTEYESRLYVNPEVSLNEQLEWRDVVGWEGIYRVSSNGDIMKLPYTTVLSTGKTSYHRGKILKRNVPASNGYFMVELRSPLQDNKIERTTVHRIVAKAFIPNQNGKRVINHINGNKLDNRVENLEWVTDSENIRHAKDVLGHISGTPPIKTMCVEEGIVFDTISEAAGWLCDNNGYKNIESAISNISAVLRGDRSMVGGYHWKKVKETE